MVDAGELKTPIYVRINDVETEIGTLTVIPHIEAKTDLDPSALLVIRNTPLPTATTAD